MSIELQAIKAQASSGDVVIDEAGRVVDATIRQSLNRASISSSDASSLLVLP